MRPDKVILITGGTGWQGTATAKALCQRGWRVRVLTRDPSSQKAQAVAAVGAELISGNLASRDSVDGAMAGVDGVFCVIPGATSYDPKEAFQHQLACSINVIDAAAAANVKHFILGSAHSANREVNSNLANKFKLEEHARATGLRATFLRPVAFMENFSRPQWGLHQQLFTTGLLPTTRQPLIALEDIAALAAIMFEKPHDAGARILEIAGDELTPAEMAAALSEALGRPIPCMYISTDTLQKLNENSGKGYARINAGEMNPVDIPAIRRIHPGLMGFKTWLATTGAEQLKPLLPLYRRGAYLAELPAWRLENVLD
jgi:uncharacterized protein YbjT (DUF2867 family)